MMSPEQPPADGGATRAGEGLGQGGGPPPPRVRRTRVVPTRWVDAKPGRLKRVALTSFSLAIISLGAYLSMAAWVLLESSGLIEYEDPESYNSGQSTRFFDGTLLALLGPSVIPAVPGVAALRSRRREKTVYRRYALAGIMLPPLGLATNMVVAVTILLRNW